jgi:hypothetical protein
MLMKSLKVSCLFVALLLVAAPAFAADVDGKWSGALATPNGDVNVAFEFKADGTALTGTTTGPDGAPTAIKNGKIDGNTITFVVTVAFGDMSFDINYTGMVSPAEIKMTADFAGMPFEFVVKKAA